MLLTLLVSRLSMGRPDVIDLMADYSRGWRVFTAYIFQSPKSMACPLHRGAQALCEAGPSLLPWSIGGIWECSVYVPL